MEGPAAGGLVNFSRFGALRAAAQVDRAGALEQAANEFEALFVELMLKAAREAEMGDGMFDSPAARTYREMFDQQLALTLSGQQDLGVARLLERQFAVHAPAEADADDARAEQGGAVPAPGAAQALRRFAGPSPHAAAAVAPASAVALDTEPRPKQSEFVQQLMPHAAAAGRRLGVSARAIIAQAALETGWGQHVMRLPDGRSSHNYFGIKAGAAWGGSVVNVATTEFLAGRAVTVNAAFRAYDDPAAAFDDYVQLLGSHPRYAGVLGAGADVGGFAHGLARAGYATDPRYAEKIIAIIETGDWSDLSMPNHLLEHGS